MRSVTLPIGQVNKIIHLADIHIRLYKRSEEYRECFERLYKDITARLCTGSVIVVAGDVVHNKTDMSPELVNLTSSFLKSLADLAPTILIAGNHDLNMANKNRLDALTPIVDSLKHPDLHYLKQSGVYHCANVDFAVLSIIGDRSEWPTPSDCTAPTKIALFHDAVFGAQTDVGFSVQKQSMMVEDFAGYDIVLLGDIHRHQVLKDANPIIVYPGSLIQQNHGESLGGHGWCEWNVDKRSFKFHELHNDYGYYTLEIQSPEDQASHSMSSVPAKPYLRVFTRGYDHAQVKLWEAFYRNQRDVQEWSHTPLDGMRKNVNVDALGNIIDITDVDLQNSLIRQYLKESKPELSEETIERVLQLNGDANEKVGSEDLARKIVWRPLSLKFDNLFTYGEGNYINFEEMHDVVGIFAPNATGKTSIAEAICFALYDRTPRATKAANIMNTRSDKCYLEFRFEIEGVEYVVERRGTKSKKGEVKIDVDFYRLENGDRTSLNGSERRYTDENIRQFVGDFDEFLLTTFSSSSQQGLFVDRGQAERKNLLGQFLGLKIFDELHEFAKRESKGLEGTVTRFRKDNTAEELVRVEESIVTLTDRERDAETALEITNEQLNALTESIQQQYLEVTPLSGVSSDVNALDAEMNMHHRTVERQQQDIQTATEKLSKLREQLTRAELKLTTEYTDTEEQFASYNQLKTQLTLVESRLRSDTRTLSASEARLQQLRTHDFDANCVKCVTNAASTINSIESTELEIADLKQRVSLDQALQSSTTALISVLNDVEEKYEKLLAGRKWIQNAKVDIPKLEAEISRLAASQDSTRGLIEKTEQKIAEYHAHADAIEANKRIMAIIQQFETQKTVAKRTFTQQQTECKDVSAKLAVAKQKHVDLLGRIAEASAVEAQYEAFKLYMDVVGKDGLPFKMIAEILPSLQVSVNSVLNQMVGFNLEFETENQNVNIKLIYNEEQSWSLDLASGMEKFISSLAIRVALSQISALPKSTFLVLDEGMGTLDKENLGQIYALFDMLRTQFDFIMLITHIEAVKDVADQLVEIQRDNGFSRIEVH
jgi:DNA repair exonuclease SbcCD ATPase subunit/DNA repair exonuclease SbcCD nuclease subunit